MFNIEGTTVNVSLDMDLDEIRELKEFLSGRLEYIDDVGVDTEQGEFATSALIQLLASLKKSRPEIQIPFLEQSCQLDKFGKLHWKLNHG